MAEYDNTARAHIFSNPDLNVPASQKYNANIWLFSDVPGEVVKIKYGTFTEMEGPWMFQTPVKQSTEVFSLETINADETFLALQIALLGKGRTAVIVEDVTLSDPNLSFNTANLGSDAMIEIRGGASAQVTSFLNSATVRGGFWSSIWKAAKAVLNLSDNDIRVIIQIKAADGSYVWAIFTGTTQSLEEIVFVDEDGNIVSVVRPDDMEEIEGDQTIDEWLEANSQYISGQPGAGGDIPRADDVGTSVPVNIPRRFLQCTPVPYSDGRAGTSCRWIRIPG